MTTAKSRKRRSHKPSSIVKEPAARGPLPSHSTLAELVHRIGILGSRIDIYVQFMCKIEEHAGLSDEMKSRAALDFHEELIIVERQLGRIHDEYRLE